MPHIAIRQARAEDRDAVLAFCQNTWDWGDYIERVWDDWLRDPQGRLFVATAGDVPVGVTHVRMLNTTDAWLEGIRVHPAYRQQGIARALNEAMLVEAMQRGATNARLITESSNTAAIQLVQGKHMQQVGGFLPLSAQPMTQPPAERYTLDEPTLASAGDLEEIISYLDVSSIFPSTGGLYYHGFTAYGITDTLLKEKIAARQAYLLRRWERLDGLAIVETREGVMGKQLLIGYIDGTTEAISLLAYALRRQAANMRLDMVRAHIPDLIMVRDAFTGAGYEWEGRTYLTFERSLDV